MGNFPAIGEPDVPVGNGQQGWWRTKLRFSLRQLLGLMSAVAVTAGLMAYLPLEFWLFVLVLAAWAAAAVLLPLVGFAVVVLLVRAAGLLLRSVSLLRPRRDSD